MSNIKFNLTLLLLILIIVTVVCSIFNINIVIYSISLAVLFLYYFIGMALFSPTVPRWYKIYKHTHYSINSKLSVFFIFSRFVNLTKYKTLTFSIPSNEFYSNSGFIFDSSHHKLFGVTKNTVHKDSTRFTFKYIDENTIELYLYNYIKGDLYVSYINTYKTCVLNTVDLSYIKTKIGFSLFPYYGGKYTNPKDLNIYLKLNK